MSDNKPGITVTVNDASETRIINNDPPKGVNTDAAAEPKKGGK